jgi:hypothetical protein
MTRSVLKLLEENRKTIQSLNNTGTAMDMTTTTTTASNTTTTTTSHSTIHPNNCNNNTTDDTTTVQEILEDLLEQEQWKNQRASKLDLDDFLQLLVEFNARGIHFS